MKKKFENLTEITDCLTYDKIRAYFEALIEYATKNGYLDKKGADNNYVREIGRVGGMLADYESIYMDLSPLTFKKTSIVHRKGGNRLNQTQREAV